MKPTKEFKLVQRVERGRQAFLQLNKARDKARQVASEIAGCYLDWSFDQIEKYLDLTIAHFQIQHALTLARSFNEAIKQAEVEIQLSK